MTSVKKKMNYKDIQQHNQFVYNHLEIGDLLEFKRGLYSHWAVYIGDDEVVHLAGEDDDGLKNNVQGKHMFTISGKTFNKACVRIDNFWDVAAGDRVNRNNTKDRKLTPYPPSIIVERALSKIGRIGYNILFSNCEHFVSWCRYNMEISEQADSFKTGFFVGMAALATVGLVAFLGGGKKDKRKASEY